MKLFLLNPNFHDSRLTPPEQPYYCPHCAMVEGILQYYPGLREKMEVIYVDFPRPRNAIIELIGEENQGCPVLLISKAENETTDTSYFKSHGDWYLLITSTT